MTNKLRSVIEDILNSFSPENHSSHHQDASRYSMRKLIDAIIEEIEEQAKTTKQHIDEMKKLNYTEQDIDFDRGKTMYAIDLSQSLKQAREELSTSITQ